MFKTSSGAISLENLAEIQSIQAKSRLPSKDGFLEPTISFLESVAKYMETVFQKKVSVTQALQIWYAASIIQSHLSELDKLKADVACWYGINPFNLTKRQIASLHGNLPRVKAQQRIERGDYDQTCVKTAYDIWMVAYDDETKALAARAAAAKLKSQTPTGN